VALIESEAGLIARLRVKPVWMNSHNLLMSYWVK